MSRLLLLACFAGTAMLASAARAETIVPVSIDEAKAFRPLEKADGALVERLTFARRGTQYAHQSTWIEGFPIASQAAAPRTWVRDLKDVLATAGEYSRFQRCPLSVSPEDSTGFATYRVMLPAGRESLVVTLDFVSRCIQFGMASGPGGRVAMGSAADTLFGLMRRALEADTYMAGATIPNGHAYIGRASSTPLAGASTQVETLPEVIERVAPDYPKDARSAGIEGTVVVQALVGASGNVLDAFVKFSIMQLDEAAIDAVRRWRFKPATADGKPAAVWVTIPVNFKLR